MFSFETVLDAFEFVSCGRPFEHRAYLNKETGEVFCHSEFGDNAEPLPDDVDDADKYVAIPHKNDLDLGQRLVMRFTDEFLPDDGGKVRGIFGRPGAYARFKDLLEARGLLQKWYDYEDKAQREALREWCKEEGINVGE